MPLEVECPHCGKPIQPAVLLGKLRAKAMTREERSRGGRNRHFGKPAAAIPARRSAEGVSAPEPAAGAHPVAEDGDRAVALPAAEPAQKPWVKTLACRNNGCPRCRIGICPCECHREG